MNTDTRERIERHEVRNLSTILNEVCKDHGIRMFYYEDVPQIMEHIGIDPLKTSGLSIKNPDGTFVILFRKGMTNEEARFTVAHELGHILLGHLGYRKSVWDNYPDFAESEANYFAVSLFTHDLICKYGQAD